VDQENQRHALVRRRVEQAAGDDFRQPKAVGHLPARAQLTPWPKELPQWDSLSCEEKKLFIKQADVYGAYQAYTDHEDRSGHPGRRRPRPTRQHPDHLHQRRQRRERRRDAQRHTERVHHLQRHSRAVTDQFLWYEFWGSDRTYPHFAAPWAWAFDTPFKWMKQVASHFGGTAQGVAMSWPGHINDVGGIRRQFHHVIDIVPDHPRSDRHPASP
jgi:hypothetical protein